MPVIEHCFPFQERDRMKRAWHLLFNFAKMFPLIIVPIIIFDLGGNYLYYSASHPITLETREWLEIRFYVYFAILMFTMLISGVCMLFISSQSKFNPFLSQSLQQENENIIFEFRNCAFFYIASSFLSLCFLSYLYHNKIPLL